MTDSTLPGGSTGAPAPHEPLAVAQARARAWASLFEDGTRSGMRLGRYVLLEELGAGAMGLVYAAYDPDLDRKVAIKVLRGLPSERDADEAARLVLEARALAKLSHPNVVAVHDVGLVEPEGAEADPTGLLRLPFAQAKALTVSAFERRYVTATLERTGNNISAAALAAGMDRSNFRRLMKELQIAPRRDEERAEEAG